MLGTAAAGVMPLSGGTPKVAVPLPDRAVAKAADRGRWWLPAHGFRRRGVRLWGRFLLPEPDEYAPQLPGCRDRLRTHTRSSQSLSCMLSSGYADVASIRLSATRVSKTGLSSRSHAGRRVSGSSE